MCATYGRRPKNCARGIALCTWSSCCGWPCAGYGVPSTCALHTWLHKGALMCWPAQRSSAAAKVDAGADITLAVANWGPGSGVARLAVAAEILSGGEQCNVQRYSSSGAVPRTEHHHSSNHHHRPSNSNASSHPHHHRCVAAFISTPPLFACGRRPKDR